MKIFRVDGELTVVIVADDFLEAESEADYEARNEEISWNAHEIDLTKPYWGDFDGIPYGPSYYADSPNLTIDEIVKRYKQELVEKKKQEELNKLQLKMFE